ncbi:hypothetical protein HZC53_00935 [Candidatus Uhrbacteria bacterium]|nr:hypothetical protein [Candidatus Uhrbacteria bacterium]
MDQAFPQSSRSIDDLDVRLASSDLFISFKGFQGFCPAAFEGGSVALEVVTDQGLKQLHGQLRSEPVSGPRGVWYRYRFVPDKDYEIFWILDWDSLWTNVKKVSIATPSGSFAAENPFFRAPPAIAV